MTFEEITRLVVSGQEPPENALLEDWYCYLSLETLLASYQTGRISQERAAKARVSLEHAHRQAVEEAFRQSAMYAEYQHNIQLAQEAVWKLCKGKNDGKGPEQLLSDAVRCIAALTGDRALISHFGADCLEEARGPREVL